MALPGSGLIRFGRWAAAAEASPSELVAALPVPMLILNAENRIADANAAAELLFNLSRQAIIGRSVAALIGHPMDMVAADAPFAAYDVDLRIAGDRRLQADVMAAPLPDRAGWRIVTVHSRAPAHIAHRRADREGGKRTAVGAAAMLAHEIKNPLSAIRGAAQLIEGDRDAAASDLTQLIREEVDRIAALIDRMQDFADTRPLDLVPLNIHTVLAHAREVALQGFARGRVIREAYDPSLPLVQGHRDSLVQIVLNLIRNAVEASDHGAITLATAYRHGVSRLTGDGGSGRRALPIELAVIDDGPGAPPDLVEHLFDPFVSTKQAGGGLGLALVDKLIADQGGMAEYAREDDPPRTIVRVLLPRAAG